MASLISQPTPASGPTTSATLSFPQLGGGQQPACDYSPSGQE